MLHRKHPRVFLRAQDHRSLSPMIKVALFMVFCRQAISESPDLRTMYIISVFIGVYMFVAHETSQGFLTRAGSRIPVAYDKGGPVKFLVFCRRAISESPDLRTMYMISVFI